MSIFLFGCSENQKTDTGNKTISSQKHLSPKEVDDCINKKIVAFRKENGEYSLIKYDVLEEWETDCKKGQ